MRKSANIDFRRRELLAVIVLTVLLWVVALVLWSAEDLASGEPFSTPYKILLAETFGLGMLFSALIFVVIAMVRPLGTMPSVLIIGICAISVAFLHALIDAFMLQDLYMVLGLGVSSIRKLFSRGLMPFVMIYGFYASTLGLILSSMAVRDSERRLAQAQNVAQQAQLAALRFQLNPHFLFNTLNAISALIVTDEKADAERMTVKLSEFLRVSLESDPEAEVTLDEELATTQSYLDIESVRFPQKLRTEFECPAGLLNAYVPSFLLQPIVENAIKYAVAPSRHPVNVSVRVRESRGSLCLTVEDNGGQAFGVQPAVGTGLGLANVRKRLEAFYGALASFDATATERGFVVTLSLPLRYNQKQLAAE